MRAFALHWHFFFLYRHLCFPHRAGGPQEDVFSDSGGGKIQHCVSSPLAITRSRPQAGHPSGSQGAENNLGSRGDERGALVPRPSPSPLTSTQGLRFKGSEKPEALVGQ